MIHFNFAGTNCCQQSLMILFILVVNSGHSAQSNPRTVEEVRRILLLHVAETCEQTGVACIRPADDNGGSTTSSHVQAR